jgi:xanthosine utilization system XapX-like protein
VISFFRWQYRPLPVQHLAVGICTMLVGNEAYGFLWELSPMSVAWYNWALEVPLAARIRTAPVEIRQPPKK